MLTHIWLLHPDVDAMDQLQTEDIHKVLEIYLSHEPVAIVKAGDLETSLQH